MLYTAAVSWWTTRNTCIQKNNLIFLFCDVDTYVEQKCNQRGFTHTEELSEVETAAGTAPAQKFQNLYCLQTPMWPTCNASFHWLWLCPCLTSSSSIDYPFHPCIVRFSLAIVLRPLTACIPITTLLIFFAAGCIYQNIHYVQPHLQVKVIFRYLLCWFYQRPDVWPKHL